MSAKREGRTERPASRTAGRVLGRVMPVVAAVGAFAALVLVFRITFPWIADRGSSSETAATESGTTAAATQEQATYMGVSDVWTGGVFTTGVAELDTQVKAYCDALSDESLGAKANAQNVYNNTVLSTYLDRTADEGVSGDGWNVAVAKHFFSTGSPADGIGGGGDTYEFAAVTAFCLRYFGYSDAVAIPVYREEYDDHGAVCLVTDENGYSRLCDPSYGTDGWMLDPTVFPITVENIGQDLSLVNSLGLKVVQPTENTTEPPAETQPTEEYVDYEYYDEYGY